MTLEEFKEGFDQLTNAFSVVKPEHKMSIYYKFLNKIPARSFSEIVENLIRSTSRFPSISDILSQYLSKSSDEKKKADCLYCDGYGTVKVGLKIFRAECAHGDELSKNTKRIRHFEYDFEIEKQKKEMADFYGEEYAKTFVYSKPQKTADITEIISRSPEQCFKGILWLLDGDSSRLKNTPQTFKNFANNTIELLGKKRCQDIKKEWLENRKGMLTIPAPSLV